MAWTIKGEIPKIKEGEGAAMGWSELIQTFNPEILQMAFYRKVSGLEISLILEIPRATATEPNTWTFNELITEEPHA